MSVEASLSEALAQWQSDRLDSTSSASEREGHFDPALNAWVLSQHSDVVSALRCALLVPVGVRGRTHANSQDDAVRLATRAQIVEALSPQVLAHLDTVIVQAGEQILKCLPISEPIDLIAVYARPVCRVAAMTMTGLSTPLGASLIPDAEKVSASAAEPFDETLALEAKAASARLRTCFHSGPLPLRHSGFIALSQTLCALLGNAWFALLQQPAEWARLHEDPGSIRLAVEELLRYAGLTRMLFRIAIADVDFNGMQIRKGDRLILRIAAANKDPLHFANPKDIVFDRRPLDHLTLGSGKHACVAGPLIRTVIATTTRLLVESYASATLRRPVEWCGGSGFLFPDALYTILAA